MHPTNIIHDPSHKNNPQYIPQKITHDASHKKITHNASRKKITQDASQKDYPQRIITAKWRRSDAWVILFMAYVLLEMYWRGSHTDND
jgi:hypothetical protein